MVSQSSILFLLAFSAIAVSARPFDRRAPGGTTDQAGPTTDPTQGGRETFNKVLACTDDLMKTPKVPLGTTAEPGQSPLPWVDAFEKCIEMYYPKSAQAQGPPGGQEGDKPEGAELSGGQTLPGMQAGPDGQTAPPPPPGEQPGPDGQTAPPP
jgi:hypothetical protein